MAEVAQIRTVAGRKKKNNLWFQSRIRAPSSTVGCREIPRHSGSSPSSLLRPERISPSHTHEIGVPLKSFPGRLLINCTSGKVRASILIQFSRVSTIVLFTSVAFHSISRVQQVGTSPSLSPLATLPVSVRSERSHHTDQSVVTHCRFNRFALIHQYQVF